MTDLSGYAKKSTANGDTRSGLRLRLRIAAIAHDLNKDAVPTAQGAPAWSQATVRALLMREGVAARCAPGKARYSLTLRREIVLSVGWFGS